LRKEKEKLSGDAVHANSFYEVVTQNALLGHVYSSAEREEIDRFMRQRERLLKRLARVDRDLATIQTDGLVIPTPRRMKFRPPSERIRRNSTTPSAWS
jgi:hypothetical protein